jgi:hypothetical protein
MKRGYQAHRLKTCATDLLNFSGQSLMRLSSTGNHKKTIMHFKPDLRHHFESTEVA